MKFKSIKEFIIYRNKIITRLRSRSLHFGNNDNNYYYYRLQELNSLYPEYKDFGIIRLK